MEFKKFIEYDNLLSRFKKACKANNLKCSDIGFGILVAEMSGPGKSICLVGGVHGDERSGPHAIVDFLETKPSKNLILIPCAAPYAFKKNSRVSIDRKNFNRQFDKSNPPKEAGAVDDYLNSKNIELLISLHEDDSSDGIYLYYSMPQIRGLCEKMIQVAKKHIPINTKKQIRNDKTEKPGMIYIHTPEQKQENKKSLEGWADKKGIPSICFEVPTKYGMKKNINCCLDILKQI
jgi:predicted deacylase